MPKGAGAGSTRTRASSTWMPTASMPPSSIPVSACSRAPSRIPALPPGCAAPTTAGSPITASRIPSASSGSRCCRCSRSSWRSTRCATHAMEMMLVALSVIWGGVVDRHPRLRIAFLESGGGWIAPWLDRMDRHFDDKGFNDSGLTTRPSELFQRNCWISFEPVEGSIKALADYIGPHKILWATDYPHPDGFFPGAPKMIMDRMEGLSAETKHQVMAGGAMGLYGLN